MPLGLGTIVRGDSRAATFLLQLDLHPLRTLLLLVLSLSLSLSLRLALRLLHDLLLLLLLGEHLLLSRRGSLAPVRGHHRSPLTVLHRDPIPLDQPLLG